MYCKIVGPVFSRVSHSALQRLTVAMAACLEESHSGSCTSSVGAVGPVTEGSPDMNKILRQIPSRLMPPIGYKDVAEGF